MIHLKTTIKHLIVFAFVSFFTFAFAQKAENLDRGTIAVRHEDGKAFISWRLLESDPETTVFNIYRSAENGKFRKLNEKPISTSTCFTDGSADFTKDNTWKIIPVLQGKEQEKKAHEFTLPANAPVRQYISIPLQNPEGYTPNDGSVADLDGDGEYEVVIHQSGKGHDNSHKGFTDEPVLQAYEMDGTLLWAINLGQNIREGAHYTQFIVYDLDGDGKAEVACKTADGTTDSKGKIIGDPDADHRNENGYILKGPEFLSVFDGQTGAALATTEYLPPRHPDTLEPTSDQLKDIWGDGYGNRCDRFLACVAYLDGQRPSLVMTRGYYTRSVLAAWNFQEGKLSHVWTFDSDDPAKPENRKYRGQGNHNLSVGDVDGDGRDEIVFGACVIDDNGEGLYSTGLGHGDALHLSDLDPTRPGLEIFNIQERFDDAGANFRDANSGEILWRIPSVKAGDDGEGPGRGNSFNIDPRHPGHESWVFGAGISGIFNAKGEKISETTPGACNFAVWWDGDLLRELLDKNIISKWDWEEEKLKPLLVAQECVSNNGTKSTPVLSADLFGDWREEVIWRSEDNSELRIYTTVIPTEYRFPTLMQDHIYRMGIVWQNVGYNQPPHTSFYLGE